MKHTVQVCFQQHPAAPAPSTLEAEVTMEQGLRGARQPRGAGAGWAADAPSLPGSAL